MIVYFTTLVIRLSKSSPNIKSLTVSYETVIRKLVAWCCHPKFKTRRQKTISVYRGLFKTIAFYTRTQTFIYKKIMNPKTRAHIETKRS